MLSVSKSVFFQSFNPALFANNGIYPSTFCGLGFAMLSLRSRHGSKLLKRCIGLSSLKRMSSKVASVNQHVAIIGSGPSGFYTAKYLLEKNPDLHVDIIEQMPVPFGLVRYGVAPDHPEVKAVQTTFEQVATNPRFRFFGNVEVQRDNTFSQYSSKNTSSHSSASNTVSIEELRKSYRAVVLACGAVDDRALDISNEHSGGVLSARSFVNWYNGHPDYVHVLHKNNIDLSKIHDVAIIGHGNVAIDCARILAKTTDELAATDISKHALEELKGSSVSDIHMIGRRGALQSAYTIKELRELTKLAAAKVLISKDDFQQSCNEASLQEVENKRPLKRLFQLTKEIVEDTAASVGVTPSAVAEDAGEEEKNDRRRNIHIDFFKRPYAVLATDNEPLPPLPLKDRAHDHQLSSIAIPNSTVGAKVTKLDRNKQVIGIALHKTELVGPPGSQCAVDTTDEAGGDNSLINLPCQLLLISVGYKSVIYPGVPFDSA